MSAAVAGAGLLPELSGAASSSRRETRQAVLHALGAAAALPSLTAGFDAALRAVRSPLCGALASADPADAEAARHVLCAASRARSDAIGATAPLRDAIREALSQPTAFAAAVEAAAAVAACEARVSCTSAAEMLLEGSLLASLAALLRPPLEPARAAEILPPACALVHAPFGPLASEDAEQGGGHSTPMMLSERVLRNFYEAILRSGLVQAITASVTLLPPALLANPAALLSRLVVGSPPLAKAFAEASGHSGPVARHLLSPDNPAGTLTDALLTISQLARLSRDWCAPLAEAGIEAALQRALTHADPHVRARAANLVGNLCRHSDVFYGRLLQSRLVPELIACCTDPDRATRKFACFALGNAGFHSDVLYPALSPAVAPLVTLLRDEDEKTRANAAGALGNLVRNSPRLCPVRRDGG